MTRPGSSYILERTPTISGDHLVDAQPSFDQNNQPAVSFRLNPAGGRIFGEYTAKNVGNPFAIVLDERVISAPVIQSHIPGGSGIITGRFSINESTQLAIQLRAGALPAKVVYLEERTVGPELGQDSIDAGRVACVVAFAAILVFMGLSYGVFGLFANVALIINVALIFGLLSAIGATLTLPGNRRNRVDDRHGGRRECPGVRADSRGTAEFEGSGTGGRGRLRNAPCPRSSMPNITTLIAAVILFAMGAGPVRGFRDHPWSRNPDLGFYRDLGNTPDDRDTAGLPPAEDNRGLNESCASSSYPLEHA